METGRESKQSVKVFETAWACFVGNITASSMVNTVDEITHLRSVGNLQDLGYIQMCL